MVHGGGFCDNMSRGGKRCHTQHGGGPYLTVDIMLGGRPGLFSMVNQGLCQDFQGGVRVFCYTSLVKHDISKSGTHPVLF